MKAAALAALLLAPNLAPAMAETRAIFAGAWQVDIPEGYRHLGAPDPGGPVWEGFELRDAPGRSGEGPPDADIRIAFMRVEVLRTETPRPVADWDATIEVTPEAGTEEILRTLATPEGQDHGDPYSVFLGHYDAATERFHGVTALVPMVFLWRLDDAVMCGFILNAAEVARMEQAIRDRPGLASPTALSAEAAEMLRALPVFGRLEAIMATLRPAP